MDDDSMPSEQEMKDMLFGGLVASAAERLLGMSCAAADMGVRSLFVAVSGSKKTEEHNAIVVVLGGKIPKADLVALAKHVDGLIQDLHAGDPNAPKLHREGIANDETPD